MITIERRTQALYLGVIQALLDRERAWFEAHPVTVDADPFVALGQLMRAGIGFARDNRDLDAFSRSFLHEKGRPIFFVALQHFSAADAAGVPEVIARGFAVGAFRQDLPPAFVGRALGLVLSGVAELLDGEADVDAQLRWVVDFLRGGLGRS